MVKEGREGIGSGGKNAFSFFLFPRPPAKCDYISREKRRREERFAITGKGKKKEGASVSEGDPRKKERTWNKLGSRTHHKDSNQYQNTALTLWVRLD